jgi:DMSO/TMAO reductase YedYZ heme-binding membrane subunit
MSLTLAAAGNAKTLWFVTRATGVVALLLLTTGVVLGVLTSMRWRGRNLPRFVVAGLHRNVTLLALAFVCVHVVTTIADGFAPIGLRDAVIPFLSPYRPVWLGLGAVAFDLLLALIITSLLRTRLGIRRWRAVHWLAYASWPVALVHAFGTGSDPRRSWFPALAIVCIGLVVVAVLVRVVAARDTQPAIRVTAAAAALTIPLVVFVWARGGPLRPGWASAAGTPKTLLASRRVRVAARAAPSTPARPPAAKLPSGSFRASLDGRISESSAAHGLVLVGIDAAARGAFRGRVHVSLRGTPLGDGGVQMLTSSVALLPRGGASWFAGHVVALDGQRIAAVVRGDHGPLQLVLDLQLNAERHSVTGVLNGKPA